MTLETTDRAGSAGTGDREDEVFDVAIVGFGPSGVTAANLLGQAGVRTVIVEREREVYARARAVVVDDEVLRIFQRTGLADTVKADTNTNNRLRWRTYRGRTFFAMHPTESDYGQPPSAMIYQPVFESTLRDGAQRFAEVLDLRFGVELVSLSQDGDGVDLAVRDVESGEDGTIRARYVLGCDGGSSSLRTQLGIELAGSTYQETWVVVDAKVRRWWPDQDYQTFWSDAERPAVDIRTALGHHRWEFPLREGERREDLESSDSLWKFLGRYGVTPDHVEILRHVFYEHHVRRAERWRSGRVMLLGDAAHMMPPWAGQGMCAGIKDASNLAWKLDGIVRGTLDDSVLDTYQPEREPSVVEVTQLSRGLGWLVGARNPAVITVRNNVLDGVRRLPGLCHYIEQFKFKPAPKIAAGFIVGRPGRRSAVGRYLPQPKVADVTTAQVLLDERLGIGFSVLGRDIDPRAAMSNADMDAWSALGARFLAVRSMDRASEDDSDIIDVHRVLVPWMERHGARVIVVRPDRYVAATDVAGLGLPAGVRRHALASAAGTGASA